MQVHVRLAASSAFFVLFAVTAARPAESTPSAPKVPTKDEIVELSPFMVNTSSDVGYVAENTLAGSRLNTKLKDTASSVSVFTKEFLDDLAITDLSQLLEYSVNSEMDTNSQGASSEQNRIIGGHALSAGIQIRGLLASVGMDFFTSITPMDPYRVGRIDDARGPNSILFGIGQPGGLLNQSSKIAATHRDSGALRYGMGSWSRSRSELDLNKVLVKNRLAARCVRAPPGKRRLARLRFSGQGPRVRLGDLAAGAQRDAHGDGREGPRQDRRGPLVWRCRAGARVV